MRTKPTKLTPALQESICATLSMGVDVATACRREGIGRSTYFEWLKRGRAGEQPYADFVDATERAHAEVEIDVTRNIIAHSKRRWQAGAWWLKWRATGGVQRIELTGKDGQPISGQLTAESAEMIRQRILFGDAPAPAPKQLEAPSDPSRLLYQGEDEQNDADGVEPALGA